MAAFENRTGERIFDGTLEYALTRELANSRYVNVVSRERIGDALRLMRRPPNTVVDAAVGREICLRDGEIRVLVTGRVEKLGSRYLFSAEIVDPKAGTTLAGASEESAGKEGSLAAVRRLSDQVRERLGEAQSSEERRKAALPKVTTSSLKALQLYSQAEAIMLAEEDNYAAAEELLKQAVAEDPEFASAYIYLAHEVNNQGRPLDEFRPYLETALRLSDQTTERERYFIRGSYYHLLGQKEKAAAAYEALVSLYPDHPWAWSNLAGSVGSLYEFPKDLKKIVQVEQRLADLRPNDFDANFDAAYNLVVWKRDFVRAGPYLRRARALLVNPGYNEDSINAGWIEVLPVAEKWLAGESREAVEELNRLSARIDIVSVPRARELIAGRVGFWYLALGLLERAESVFKKIPDPLIRSELLAQVSFIENKADTLRDQLELRGQKEVRGYPGAQATIVLVGRSGLTGQALQPWLTALKSRRAPQDDLEIFRGEQALARGEIGLGVALLRKGLYDRRDQDYLLGDAMVQLGRESLAVALDKRGETQSAIAVLEQASQGRARYLSAMGVSPAYWTRNRCQLARLYRKVGREAEARAIETELLKLLSLADADHPILVALKKSSASETVAAAKSPSR